MRKQVHDERMTRFTEFLMDNLDQTLSLAEMAEAIWVSESTLRRLVHRYAGCGPNTYFQKLRMQEAKRLLATTGLTITQISVRLGFSSINYFSRTFKAKTGYSPTEYAGEVQSINEGNKGVEGGWEYMFHNVSPERVGISSKNILKFIKTLEKYHFCTHSIIMARGKKIFAEGYYSPFRKDSKHRMYSVSKSFVSVAVGLAIEDGLLSLEDKMVKFFPEYMNEKSNSFLEEMTIREMLTMETCKNASTWWFNSGTEDRTEVYFREAADRVPGTTWFYDSPASYMLGVIVEKLTGKPFLEYLKERVLLQAGFSEDAYCLRCPGGYSFSDSGVMCTARDLLAFARFVMDDGMIEGVRYMNAEYLREATKKQVSNSHAGEVNFYSYGYGYQIWKTPRNGFAFIGMGDQLAICDRETDFIFIITSDNQGHSEKSRTILYHTLYEEIVEQLGEPLEEDAEGYGELQAYIAQLKLFALDEKKVSPWMEKINGCTYRLDKNPMGIEFVKFDFQGNEGVLTYRNAQGVKNIPFGLGHNVFSKFPEEGYSDIVATVPEPGNKYDCAVSADWPEPCKLRIKVQIIDKYLGNLSMEFGFKEDTVGIYMLKTAEAFLEEYQGYANGRKE